MLKLKARDHENYTTFSIICLLFPFIGIILGIVYLTKQDELDRKLGEHMLAFSILAWILWGIVWLVWSNAQDVNSIQYINL